MQRYFLHKIFRVPPSTFKDSDFWSLHHTDVKVMLLQSSSFSARVRFFCKHAASIKGLLQQMMDQ
eukprot:6944783-Karenia_brevis.AAC.1